MIESKKGQVVILDFIYAVLLIIFLFIILFKYVEADFYKTESEIDNKYFDNVSKQSYHNLLSHPKISVYAIDSSNTFLIRNSLFEDSNITKENLGLPKDFNCSVVLTGASINLNNNQCTDNYIDNNANHYFKTSFNVLVFNSSKIEKSKFRDYIKNTNYLETQELTFEVWK